MTVPDTSSEWGGTPDDPSQDTTNPVDHLNSVHDDEYSRSGMDPSFGDRGARPPVNLYADPEGLVTKQAHFDVNKSLEIFSRDPARFAAGVRIVPSTTTDFHTLTFLLGSKQQIIGEDPKRVKIVLIALGTAAIYIGNDASLVAGSSAAATPFVPSLNGMLLPTGVPFAISSISQLWAAAATDAAANVGILDVFVERYV